MAAFADYLDLRLAVAEHVNRHDLSDVMPRFVQMAEAKLNAKLRTNDQITRTALTFADGAATLPEDYLEMISAFGPAGYQTRGGTIAGAERPGSGFARYAISGNSILANGFSGARDVVYYAALPTLTSSIGATNWLLRKYPDVYLYAVGLEAAKHLRDAELVTATKALLEDAMSDLRSGDYGARWGNATVLLQGVTP